MAKSSKTKNRKKRPDSRKSIPVSFWKDKTLLIPIFSILAITFIAFFPSLDNDFVNWDDDINIIDNQYLQAFTWENIKGIFSSTVIGNYNPLSIFTFAIEKHLFGLNPFVFHLDNLLLHLLCVFLVYRIALALGLSRNAAIIIALLFGIHPMRVESVAWATERKDVLFGTFYFGAIFYYLKYLKTGFKKYYGFVLLLFVLSLFSKIQAVALPLSLLAIDYLKGKPIEWKILQNKIPLFVLSLIFGVAGVLLLDDSGSLEDPTQYNLFQRLAIGAYSYSVYIIKFLVPYEMSPLYPYKATFPVHYYAGFIGVALAVWIFIKAFLKGHRELVFGIAFFTFNVMFLLQIFGAGQGLLADRFTYIPYFGLFFLLAYGLEKIYEKNKDKQLLLKIGVGLYVLVLSVLCWRQCDIWENGKTLWTHVSQKYPNAYAAWNNLGHYYRDQKDANQAISYYTTAIEKSNRASTYNSRGKMYFEIGKTQEAIKDYSDGLSLRTNNQTKAELLVNRGSAYGRLGDFQKALQDFNEGIALDATNPNGFAMRSMVYLQQNQYDLALADYDQNLALDGSDPNIWYEKGLVLNVKGQYQEALQSLNQSINLNPNVGVYYRERAKTHVELNNIPAARQDAQNAQNLGAALPSDVLNRLK